MIFLLILGTCTLFYFIHGLILMVKDQIDRKRKNQIRIRELKINKVINSIQVEVCKRFFPMIQEQLHEVMALLLVTDDEDLRVELNKKLDGLLDDAAKITKEKQHAEEIVEEIQKELDSIKA